MKETRPKAVPVTIDHGESSKDMSDFMNAIPAENAEEEEDDQEEDQPDGEFIPSMYR